MHRYDLLCLEGLVQALHIFNGREEVPSYTLADIGRESMIKMHVKPEVTILETHFYFAVEICFSVEFYFINNEGLFFLADIFDSPLCCLCRVKRHNFG